MKQIEVNEHQEQALRRALNSLIEEESEKLENEDQTLAEVQDSTITMINMEDIKRQLDYQVHNGLNGGVLDGIRKLLRR